MPDIAVVGEVMLELAPLSPEQSSTLKLGYAGDTYNTAITLARLGAATAYVTRLGKDLYSQAILAKLASENIETSGITFSDRRIPGLYMIHNHPDGEREFAYWRGQAAAREMFASAEQASALNTFLMSCPWLYFSGITLAILGDEGRRNYIGFLQQYREQGGKIAFDSNYRPALWADKDQAQRWTRQALELCDIALLTLDDEQELWGIDAANAAQHYTAYGIDELVFKRGAEDVVVVHNGRESRFPVAKVARPLDTTAAGDNFNAGYLAARLAGASIEYAVHQACDCATVIIQHRGGVIEQDTFMQELAARQSQRV